MPTIYIRQPLYAQSSHLSPDISNLASIRATQSPFCVVPLAPRPQKLRNRRLRKSRRHLRHGDVDFEACLPSAQVRKRTDNEPDKYWLPPSHKPHTGLASLPWNKHCQAPLSFAEQSHFRYLMRIRLLGGRIMDCGCGSITARAGIG
jgi:hypothetical protein